MTDALYERETTLVFNDREDDAMLWSASPIFQRKMDKIGVKPYKIGNRENGAFSAWYKVPKSWIAVRPPRQVVLSDERRAEMAAAARIRFAKQKPLALSDDPISEN